MAYRKAKADLYFSVDSRELDLLEYEEDLEARLGALLALINGDSTEWVTQRPFTGRYSIVPKSLAFGNQGYNASNTLWSDPDSQFRARAAADKVTATFRIISQCSIDMHVLSSLWIMTVGAAFDAELSSASMGNRLRRRLDNTFNDLAVGSFKPYLEPFRRWREDGLKAIERALDDDKQVAAVTGDATSYYHQLTPDFLLDDHFISAVLEADLSENERRINELFVNSLKAWSSETADSLQSLPAGLPVGLPASAVVANLALVEFDRFVERELTPLYYGRYVDDFFLVLEGGSSLTTALEIWDWITARADPKLGLSASAEGLVFAPPYLANSSVRFENRKNRTFNLSGRSGKALISSLRRTIAEQGSEWRALPSLPATNVEIGTRMVIAMQADGDPADNLRKADSISARRAKFALQLRDFEAFQRDLDSEDWSDYREAFFESVCDHVLTPEGFFELWTYLPRLLRLALVCDDLALFSRMISRLAALLESVDLSTSRRIAGLDNAVTDPMTSWREQVTSVVRRAIASTTSAPLSSSAQAELADAVSPLDLALAEWVRVADLAELGRRLFAHDLGHLPARFAVLPQEITPRGGAELPLVRDEPTLLRALPQAVQVGFESLASLVRHKDFNAIAYAFMFPTRPPNLLELFIVGDPFESESQREVQDATQLIANSVLALRGFRIHDDMPGQVGDGASGSFISVRNSAPRQGGRRRIAIGSLETLESQSTRAAMGSPDLGLARYRRISTLVNELISRRGAADYLVLPELSLPSRWFVRVAQKLGAQGVSLVAGLEYARNGLSVRNQVWASLLHNHFGFPSLLVYRQDKQRPAPGENVTLSGLAGLQLAPVQKWSSPPIISHGGFFFAIVICSELTNIGYRASLRGRVDALFVPEWNRDIHTFEALVESAALDIHAFIVQANNRAYGDSRIRVPAVNEWERDLIRHRGGLHDYTVVGEINFHKLREHQSVFRAAKPLFKPLPDGFVVSDQRFRLPPKEK
ncbi:RNA-directed DNA polymerase [Microbacterium sp. Leaf159]|uniref:RNA-directed DNA polymerase n=1 Tax=Microbacterium sp. Leaf159 TaxID=1736279 RepID=UPI0012FBA7A9|nr:RNA-directed DNA polymerase [Microbacterium sp. Leaf159]